MVRSPSMPTEERLSSVPAATGTLIVLDVDGTISPIGPPDAIASRYTRFGNLPVDEQVIVALDRLARGSSAQIAWLTTWDEPGVAWLTGQLSGRLEGAYVPHSEDRFARPAGWRVRSLTTYLNSVRPERLVWADDDAATDGARRRLDRSGYRHRHLLLMPDRTVGLTIDNVDRIRAFVSDAARGN